MRRGLFAAALAEALLAGAWEEEGLRERAQLALGRRPKWLGVVLRDMLRAYVEAPEARELARFLDAHAALREGRVRRYLFASPVMGAMPWPVPAISTGGELAQALGVEPAVLAWFADRKGLERVVAEPLRHYRYRWIAKRVGRRLIEMPKARLRAIQRTILRDILDKVPVHPAAHGFVRGRSIRTFAEVHAGAQVVVSIDLASFFASVRRARVQAVFRACGYPEEVSRDLAALCTNVVPPALRGLEVPWLERRLLATPHLPQGAPTSPALANLCAYRLDLRLSAAAARVGARYARYADDLAFSGGPELARQRFEVLVAAIAADEGFAVRHRKTRVMRQGVQQRLVGLVVNARPNVCRAEVERLEATLHNCVRRGPETQNRAGHPDFRAHLLGKVGFVAMVNPARGAALRELFDAIVWG